MSFDAFLGATAEQQDGDDLTPPPDGTYTVALDKADAFTSKAGDFYVKLGWRVVDAVQNGYEWVDLLGHRSAKQANVSKGKITALGVDTNVSSQEELDQRLLEVVGQFFTVTVKTNGEYRNTYVDGPAGPVQADIPIPAGDMPPATAAATNDEDIPF